jgi:hypothetical protein
VKRLVLKRPEKYSQIMALIEICLKSSPSDSLTNQAVPAQSLLQKKGSGVINQPEPIFFISWA